MYKKIYPGSTRRWPFQASIQGPLAPPSLPPPPPLSSFPPSQDKVSRLNGRVNRRGMMFSAPKACNLVTLQFPWNTTVNTGCRVKSIGQSHPIACPTTVFSGGKENLGLFQTNWTPVTKHNKQYQQLSEIKF